MNSENHSDQQPEKQSRIMVLVIAGCLTGWGILLALGAYMAPSDEAQAGDFRKLWVVAAMVAAFLSLWAFVLAVRARKVKRAIQRQKDEASGSDGQGFGKH